MSSPRAKRHMTHAQRDEAVRLYLANMTVDSIAEQFERDRTTICRLVGRRAVRRGRPAARQEHAATP